MHTSDRREDRAIAHRWLRRSRKKDHSLVGAPRLSRRKLEAGVVVWAHVPYREGHGEKLRPCVVADVEGRRVRLRRMTSSATRLRYDFYVDVEDLDAAGVDRPCAVDLRSTIEVDLIELVDVVGALSPDDLVRLRARIWAVAVALGYPRSTPYRAAGRRPPEVRSSPPGSPISSNGR